MTVPTEWEVLPGLPATGPPAEPFSAPGLGPHGEGFERRELSLHGEAYSPPDDQWHPFFLDLGSGSVEGAVHRTGKRLT